MGGGPIRIARNQIAVCDLRRPLVVQAMDSATFGVTVPLHLLGPRVVGHLPQRLDPQRERLLAVRIVMLHLRLPALTAPALPDTAADLLSAIRRLLDPSTASDVLDAPELDADLAVLAQRAITEMLGRHDLTPASIAERLRVSRATLYRVFEPLGGVMAHVWSMRLEAVRTALDQPAEHRTLAQIAADHGFRTSSHLSRSFRARYGAPPREWRAAQEAQPREEWPAGLAALNSTWERLSR
jgi:AraC-like DNA-binding protein